MLIKESWAEAVKGAIIYEQGGVLAVNKPAGLCTHKPGVGYPDGVTEYVAEVTGQSYHHVHQLDRDTSGVLLFGIDRNTRASLCGQFRDRKVRKTYWALVDGRVPQDFWRDESGIGDKAARTSFKVLADLQGENNNPLTLVEAHPYTGRTHQIRVHLARAGFPIAGDQFYNDNPSTAPRQMLHALRLQCLTPRTGEPLPFQAALPSDFQNILNASAINPRVTNFTIPAIS